MYLLQDLKIGLHANLTNNKDLVQLIEKFQAQELMIALKHNFLQKENISFQDYKAQNLVNLARQHELILIVVKVNFQ